MNLIQVNGRTYDHTSLRIGLLGATMLAQMVKSIKYADRVQPTLPRGVHGIPLTRGRGMYTADGSLSTYKEAWDELLLRLPQGYTDLDFEVSVAYKARGGKGSFVQLRECSILEVDEGSDAGGSDGILVNIKLHVRYILRNGKCLYPINLDANG